MALETREREEFFIVSLHFSGEKEISQPVSELPCCSEITLDSALRAIEGKRQQGRDLPWTGQVGIGSQPCRILGEVICKGPEACEPAQRDGQARVKYGKDFSC